MRATSETLAPGSSDAATSRSFSSCDHRRRRSTDVITSALEIIIALLLGLPLGPAAFASVKQGGPQRRNTVAQALRPAQEPMLERSVRSATPPRGHRAGDGRRLQAVDGKQASSSRISEGDRLLE